MDIRNFLQYLQYEKRYSQHTIIAYENDLLQFAEFLRKTYELDNTSETRHIHVRSWMVSLMESGLSSRSINRKVSVLKTFFKFQLRNGGIQNNPLSKVVAPKQKKRLPVFIGKNQTDLLWEQVDFGQDFPGLRDRLILEILYATGIRRSELINLADKDVDFANQSIKVLGKGNKERIIPVSKQLQTALKEYLAIRNKTLKSHRFPSLLVTDEGGKMEPRKLYRIVNNTLKQITTVEKKSPHVLRHTFATHLLNNGAEINAIKELLGHSSLAATQVYTHNTIDKLKDIYKKAHPKA